MKKMKVVEEGELIMVDQIVGLENGKQYLLLDSRELDNINYYFGLRLDEKEEPTNNYLFFEEIKEDGETYLKPIEEDGMRKLLVTVFTINYLDKIYDLQ